MEDEEYRNKLLSDLQIYIPFLESMIQNLQNVAKTQEKPRSAQLDKMKSLLDLLTNRNRKMKIATLKKCEEVLSKLHQKMNGTNKLQPSSGIAKSNKSESLQPIYDYESSRSSCDSPLSAALISRLNAKNDSAPASPSPPLFQMNRCTPIIIPTERITSTDAISENISSIGVSDPIPCSRNAEDDHILLYTRRQRSPEDEHVLFRRRSRSPSKSSYKNSHTPPLNNSSDADYVENENEWKNLMDDEDDIIPRRGTSHTADATLVRRSVFARLGKKLNSESEVTAGLSCNAMVPSPSRINKIPKSAAVITNITNQIKARIMEQNIASEIAGYISESEKNSVTPSRDDTVSAVSKDKRSPITDVGHIANSCGIKKSTPSLKLQPARKLQDAGVFGDVLSSIDKKLIGQVNKSSKRKSVDGKHKKDVEVSEEREGITDSKSVTDKVRKDTTTSNEVQKNEITVKGVQYVGKEAVRTAMLKKNNAVLDLDLKKDTNMKKPEMKNPATITTAVMAQKGHTSSILNESSHGDFAYRTNIEKSLVKGDIIKNTDSRAPQINMSKLNTPSGTYERLSDKYPRKKIGDTSYLENTTKTIAQMDSDKLIPPIKDIILSPIMERVNKTPSPSKNVSNFQNTQMDDFRIIGDKEQHKITNIPDIKPNDPRVRNLRKSPTRDGPQFMNPDTDAQRFLGQSNQQLNLGFPSIVDMDYRYVTNRAMPMQQSNRFLSNNNFLPEQTITQHNNSFPRKPFRQPLLPTPAFGYNNMNDSVSASPSSAYGSPNFIENRPSDRYNHLSNDMRRRSIDIDKASYNACEYNYSPTQTYNHSRGRGNIRALSSGYNRRGSFRWSNESSRSVDCRQNSRVDLLNGVKDVKSTLSPMRSPNTDTHKSQVEHPKNDNKKILNDTNDDRSSHTSTRRTAETDQKLRKKNEFKKNNERHSYDSRTESDKKNTSSATSSAIKSYKIPKIKRDVPQNSLEDNSDGKISHKEKKCRESDEATANQSMSDRQNSAQTSSMGGDTTLASERISESCNFERKDSETASSEQSAMLSKMFELITKVCTDNKAVRDDEQLNVLQKLRETIDPKKFEKIQKILDADSDREDDNMTTPAEIDSPIVKKSKKRVKVIESDSSDEEEIMRSSGAAEKTATTVPVVEMKKTKRRNALEMLQHDVRDMFISEGVLTATGLRMCRALKEDSGNSTTALAKKEDTKTKETKNVVVARKCRSNGKKIDYCEDHDKSFSTDSIASEEEDLTKDSVIPQIPRIVLEKLNNDEAKRSGEQNSMRGRNVARRGRASGFHMSHADRCKDAPIESTENFSEESQKTESDPAKAPAISDVKKLNPKKYKKARLFNMKRRKRQLVKKPKSVGISNENNEIDDNWSETEKDSPRAMKVIPRKNVSKLKKKLKRKGAWKMGILKGKKKTKKYQLITKENEEMDAATKPMTQVKSVLNDDKSYFLNGSDKYKCKLCQFSGKMITGHYLLNHPSSEVFISRLNSEEAEAAKSESVVRCDNGLTELENGYTCRFCDITLCEKGAALMEHVSLHTGEYRYVCNICNKQAARLDNLKYHFKYLHKDRLAEASPIILYDPPNSAQGVDGYMCNYCNFTQLFEKKLEKHTKDNHPTFNLSITKIPLYKTPTSKNGNHELRKDANLRCDIDCLEIYNNSTNLNSDSCEIRKSVSLKSDIGCLENYDANKTNNEFAEEAISRKIFEEISTILQVHKPLEEEISTKKKPPVFDKKPFLSNEYELPEFMNNETFLNTNSSFEPFTKKMTITDALKNKICSLTEKQSIENVNVKVEYKTQASVHNVTTEPETNFVLSSERLNIKTEKSNCDSHKENAVEASTDDDLTLAEATEIGNADLCEWDDPDSNDSERSRMSNTIENVDEVLQNMKSFGKTSDVMSNTIQRLASNLITSPIKCNSAIRGLVASRGLDETVQDAPTKTDNFDTSLPPSEPIMLNNELITNRKIQIGTIRASVTPNNEIVYECFEKGCVFRSDIESTFVEHISNCHATSQWNGFCNICDKIVESVIGLSEGYSQSSCFQHMITMHKLDIARDENALDCKTFIKARRLSGDTLSISRPEIEVIVPRSDSTPSVDAEPFLRIESVVSLCTNFEVSNSKKIESDILPIENDLTSGSNLSETLSISAYGSGIEVAEAGKSIKEYSDTIPIKGSVKPWLYNPNARKKSIETYTPEKLSHLFKCMWQTCTYTTDDRAIFQKHLISHNFEAREQIGAHRKCFACPYCNKMYESHLTLSGHISEQHSCCRYQCGNCFYRCFSKINMKRHLETYHTGPCARNVIDLPLSANEAKEWELRHEGNIDNVIPYRCYAADCTFQTHCRFAYADHLKKPSNSPCFMGGCNMCKKRYTTAPGFINHMKTHGLNNYQCCYCIFGCELESSVLDHLARLHPEMPASAFKRDSSGEIFHLRKLDLDVPESATLPVAVLDSTAEKEHERQISTDQLSAEPSRGSPKENLNDMSYDSDCGILIIDEPKSPGRNASDVNQHSEISENRHAVNSNQLATIDIDSPRSKLSDSEIINVQSNDNNLVSNNDVPNTETFIYVEDLSNGSTKSSNDFAASSVDPLSIDQDSSKNYSVVEPANEDAAVNESFILAGLLHKNGDTDNTGARLEIDKSDIKKDIVKTDQELSAKETKDIITKDLLKYTGLGPDSLFKCAKCDVVFVYSAEYRTHVTDCIKDGIYKCAHCAKIFKYINILIDHMKMHGTQRYSCGLCDYRAARTNEVKIHMRHKHKFHKSEIYPADPCNAQPDLDLFICVPKVKEAVSNNLSSKTLNVFTPNDMDKLPRNSIYSFEVRCALCPFKTKVRSNIVRHLQQHKSESAVPHVCPVNQVPCLSSSERHFDKMTNLACSSHLNADQKPKAAPGDAVVKEQDDAELPIFVIDSKRFVCGISGCKYLTVNEEMLRHHYIALHINETSYACPHCVSEKFTGTINIEKIISHLRLHGERLYKCPKCAYHRSHRHIVERHIADKHPTSVDQVIVVRGDDSISPKVQKKDAKVLKTWVCGLCDYSAPDRGEVVNHTWEKHGTRSQYKCAHCHYRCSYKNSFMSHFAARHKGQPLEIITAYKRVDLDVANSEQRQEQLRVIDTTPLWTREQSGQRHIRGILLEEEDLENADAAVKKEEKSKKLSTESPVKKDIDIEILTNSGRRKRGSTTNYREYSDDELFYEYDKSSERSPKKAKQKSSVVEPKPTAKSNDHIPSKIKKSEISNSNTVMGTQTVNETCGERKDAINDMKESSGDVIFLSSSDDEDNIMLRDRPLNFISKSNLPPLLDEGNYGTPKDGKYCCPLCEEFCSTCEDEMCGHLYNELNYMKYSCDFCKGFSWEQSRLRKQCEESHPNIVSVIHESPCDPTIESWVTSALQQQKNTMKEMIEEHLSLEGDFYKTQDQYKNPMSTVEIKNSDETLFQCNECSYSTRSIGFFNRHKRGHMARRSSASQGLLKKDAGSSVEKKNSGKLVTESNLVITNNEKIKEFPEIVVGEVSSSEVIDVDSKPDIKIDDDGSQIIYMCHYCPKRGNTIAEIQAHWEITHKTPKFTSEGKIRGAWEFKYKTTTEQKLIEKGAKIMPKNLFMCEYCGKKGHQKALQTHHKNAHGLLEMRIDVCSDKPPMFKCVLCDFVVYAESFMKRHFALTHVGLPIAYNKMTESDLKAQTEIVDEVKTMYQCSYCVQKFNSLGDMSKHHDKFHSHKDMILRCGDHETETGTVYRRQLFKCPMCISAFVSYNHVCQHIEMHVKPFICGYCSDGFSLPDMAKLHIQRVHPGLDENCYTVVENTQAILQASINDIKVVLDNGLVLQRNMDTTNKKRMSDEDFTTPCKIRKVESLSGIEDKEPTVPRRAVAKKSTTKLPPCRPQIAKKSTAKQSLNMLLDQIYIEEDAPKSFYNTQPLYDNSKINTVLTLGGKPMRVHIDSLETITNIHPQLPLIDVKLQQQTMEEESETT